MNNVYNNGKSFDGVERAKQYLIDEMGNFVDALGGRALLGRIWGLALSSLRPLSLKEIARKLDVSKPAASSALNIGLQREVFKKIYNPDFPRENFYEMRLHSLDMIINPGTIKLYRIYTITDDALSLIEESEIFKENNKDVIKLHKHLSYIRKCFKIFLEEYDKFTEKVKERIEKIEKEFKTGVEK